MGRIALAAGVAVVLGGLYFLGAFDFVREPDSVRALLERLGPWAPLLYIVSFSLLEPFFVPGIAFMAPGALIWSVPELFLYSMLGSVGAGIVGFSFARYLARDFVERHLPERLRHWNEGLDRTGLRTVIVLRLTFFLAPPAHWLLGLSQIRPSTYVLGTAIGFAPWIAGLAWVLVHYGTAMWDWLSEQPALIWLLLLAMVLGWVGLRRWVGRRADLPGADADPA